MNEIIPIRPRGPQCRPWWRGVRMSKDNEPLEGYVLPAIVPLADGGYPFPGVRRPGELGYADHDRPSYGVATLQHEPSILDPPPLHHVTAWPYAPPWLGDAGGVATAWDAALTARHLVPTVDLSASPHWGRSPDAASLDLLARILSVRRWRLSGGLGGETYWPDSITDFAAGSYSTGGHEHVAEGAGRGGWWPVKFHTLVGGAPISGYSLHATLSLSIFSDEFLSSTEERGIVWGGDPDPDRMDAAWVEGRAVRLPRIRGSLTVYWGPDGGLYNHEARFLIDSVPRPSDDMEAPVNLPVKLCGFPLMGQAYKSYSETSLPSWGDSIEITAGEIWEPGDWDL